MLAASKSMLTLSLYSIAQETSLTTPSLWSISWRSGTTSMQRSIRKFQRIFSRVTSCSTKMSALGPEMRSGVKSRSLRASTFLKRRSSGIWADQGCLSSTWKSSDHLANPRISTNASVWLHSLRMSITRSTNLRLRNLRENIVRRLSVTLRWISSSLR